MQIGKGLSPVGTLNTLSKCKCEVNIAWWNMDLEAPEIALQVDQIQARCMPLLGVQVLLETWKPVPWPGDPAFGSKLQ